MNVGRPLALFSLFLGLAFSASALAFPPNALLDGQGNAITSLEESLRSVRPGSVVIIGENHGVTPHQQQQLMVMNELRRQGLKVSVGLEFISHPSQQALDDYRAGLIDEETFLRQVDWQNPSFDFYRPQALFPLANEGSTSLGLNVPRGVTSQIAKKGLASLTLDQLKLLPPDFTLGRASYRERFLSQMPHLPSPEAQERYFVAQSAWDDTMAWIASQFILTHPDQVLVIVVGDFHVQYGGGLPDRLRARGVSEILTFSQVQIQGLSPEEINEQTQASAVYGPRADYIWLSEGE